MRMSGAWAKVAAVAAMAWCGAAWKADGEMRYGTTTLDGYTFSYIADTRVVNGQTNEYANVRKVTPLPSGNYTIPSHLDGVPVVILSQDDLRNPCFAGAGVTELHLPPTLEIISDKVFSWCKQLTNAVLSDGLKTIGSSAFSGCSNLAQIVFPATALESIEYSAFAYCGLTNVVVPNSVTNMGTYVFSNCTSLVSAALPTGMTAIPVGTFKGCTNLVDFTLPAGVVSIGTNAFMRTGIRTLELPAGIKNLGYYSFQESALLELTVPGGAEEIPPGVLYQSAALTNLVLQEGVKHIADNICNGCTQLATVSFPDTLVDIGPQAFYNAGLQTLAIPDGVTNIGQSAFHGCAALTNVSLGNGLRDIGRFLFWGCTNLTEVAIPDCITNIGNGSFRNCSNLTFVAIGSSMESISANAFYNCSSLASVSIPDNVKTIGASAFHSCTGLVKVAIGNGVTDIGDSAFYYCPKLADVTIGNGVTNIGASAFYTCHSLSRLTIPNSVEAIGTSAFVSSGLKTLVVPASWEGTDMLDGVRLPSGCEVVYGSGGGGTATAMTPVAVPHAWLEVKAPHILAAAGGDYEAAAMAMASNGVNRVWACYVAGLEPEDPESVFSMTAKMVDGVLQLGWEPDLGAERTYEVKGSEILDSWGETNEASRFFRVNVGMPE